MENNHLVSLVVPCYNGAKYLQEFLTSLEKQDCPKLELIFVDDGSTDETWDILSAWKTQMMSEKEWTIHLKRQSNQGPAMAICEALKWVTGEFLMWADCDDVILEHGISKKANYLISHPEIGMVHSRAEFFQEDSAREFDSEQRSDIEVFDIFEKAFTGQITCLAGCYMVRTDLFWEGYPDRRIPDSIVGQNLQLLLPVSSRTLCAELPDVLYLYRIHPEGRSSRAKSLKEHMNYLEALYQLLIELIPHCSCDSAVCSALARKYVDEERRKLLMNHAARLREKKV